MEQKVFSLLYYKIDDIFRTMQDEFGIKNGDVTPMDELILNEKMHDLAMVIGSILRKQRGERF